MPFILAVVFFELGKEHIARFSLTLLYDRGEDQ